MASKKRRGISCGTLLMILITLATIGACVWFLPRFMGGYGEIRDETSHLLHVIAGENASAPSSVQGEPGDEGAAQNVLVAPTPAPKAIPTPQPTQRSLIIRAVGSVYGGKNIRRSAYDEETDTYNFSGIFEQVSPILSSADLTLATLETNFAGKEAGYGDYNTPQQLLDVLQTTGVDLISVATERALEYGPEGLLETISKIEGKGMIPVGAHPVSQEPQEITLFQVNDIQVAVLAYTYGLSKQSQSVSSKEDQAMMSYAEIDVIRSQIATARRDGASLVIVLMHWGTKDNTKLNDAQKSLGNQIAAAGADIVLGTHPNVVQPIETKQNGEHQTLIAYSLGSFLSDDREIVNAASMILTITVTMDPVTKRVELSEVSYTPTWVERITQDNRFRYRILRSGDPVVVESLDASQRKQIENAYRQVTKTVGENGFALIP